MRWGGSISQGPATGVGSGLCVCSFVPLVVLCVFHLLRFVVGYQTQKNPGRQCDRTVPVFRSQLLPDACLAGFFRVFDLGDHVGAEAGHRRVAGETW